MHRWERRASKLQAKRARMTKSGRSIFTIQKVEVDRASKPRNVRQNKAGFSFGSNT